MQRKWNKQHALRVAKEAANLSFGVIEIAAAV